MAAKRNARKQNKSKRNGGARPPMGVRGRGGNGNALDTAAADYARLLMDPCAAKVVPPIYPGGDAGYLFRAESFGTVAAGPTATAGVLHWVPGYINAGGTEIVAFEAVGGATASSPIVFGSAPGKTFLAANARGVRCVAACLRVVFPGAESARAGRVHYGHTTAGMLDVGTGASADGVATALQHYTRTPADTIELVWRPNIADTEFNDPTEVANAQLRDRKSALTFAWAGLPVAVGLTFHYTAVYEWTPAVAIGVGHNTMGKADSRNSLDDVLDAIKRGGFTYAKQAAMGGAQLAGRVATAASLSAVYGLMGGNAYQRALNFR